MAAGHLRENLAVLPGSIVTDLGERLTPPGAVTRSAARKGRPALFKNSKLGFFNNVHGEAEVLVRITSIWRIAPVETNSPQSLNEQLPAAALRSVKEKVLPRDCKLRRVKYLNNVIEQDHRAMRRRWRAAQCFRSFHTAERSLEGIEAMHMMRKGQVKRLEGSDAVGQSKLVATLFGVAP